MKQTDSYTVPNGSKRAFCYRIKEDPEQQKFCGDPKGTIVTALENGEYWVITTNIAMVQFLLSLGITPVEKGYWRQYPVAQQYEPGKVLKQQGYKVACL